MGDLTAQQASERLDRADAAPLATDRDRSVHGWATAGVGIAVGLNVVLQDIAEAHPPWKGVTLAVYLVVLVGLAAWQTRAARTVPRHSRRLCWIGLSLTVVLMMASLAMLNVSSPAVPGFWLRAALAVLIALPMLVAGWLIRRADRR